MINRRYQKIIEQSCNIWNRWRKDNFKIEIESISSRKLTFIVTILLLTGTFSFTKVLADFYRRPDFFRRGDELLEREIRRIQERKPDPTLNISTPESSSSTWHPLMFLEAGFSIWIPQGVFSQETINLKTSNEPIEFKLFTSNAVSEEFIVAYSDNLDAENIENTEAFLEKIRDAIIEETQFKLTQERSINLGKNRGKEFSLQDNTETIIFRIYLVEERLYVLGASQQIKRQQKEKVAIFFNSLQILE
ncbi:MAG: hypothetical protein QNJ54_18750 [Prochloraceae cyanobacterium]|nr:hypothetical protein [Prochloraceae cyanobacterium]